MGFVARQQILLLVISMKISLIITERKTDVLIPVTSIFLIMQLGQHEEDTFQEFKVI